MIHQNMTYGHDMGAQNIELRWRTVAEILAKDMNILKFSCYWKNLTKFATNMRKKNLAPTDEQKSS